MSLSVAGVWAVDVWDQTVWADGVWREGEYEPPSISGDVGANRQISFTQNNRLQTSSSINRKLLLTSNNRKLS